MNAIQCVSLVQFTDELKHWAMMRHTTVNSIYTLLIERAATVCGSVREFAKMGLLASSRVCPSSWNKSAYTGRIFKTFCIWIFLENLLKFLYDTATDDARRDGLSCLQIAVAISSY
jgi:thiosulfate reductase cytochrome b subunit